MDPAVYSDQPDIIQILTGLTSIVSGLAGLSNEMADRHGGRRARADARHGRLAVNCANTLCGFVVDVYEAKRQRATVNGSKPSPHAEGPETAWDWTIFFGTECSTR
jgi:hypothetical protein